ncbi:hypothetical protein LG198_08795 [Methylobacillus arboreus]|uniref:type I restriction endonuclease n=1 Tax=Methylobacillus arboreus TaxID=755170 RepID=UPI001E549C78|nr:type I restriction endonuclease [Methylobacillus arboreus]MCB5190821.1 hypothetical protein [Methylobacillus arboreus]
MNITEQQLEISTIGWFGKLGWHYANGLDIAPDSSQPARTDYRQFVLQKRLLAALPRINPHIPATAMEQATHAFLSGELYFTAAVSNSELS